MADHKVKRWAAANKKSIFKIIHTIDICNMDLRFNLIPQVIAQFLPLILITMLSIPQHRIFLQELKSLVLVKRSEVHWAVSVDWWVLFVLIVFLPSTFPWLCMGWRIEVFLYVTVTTGWNWRFGWSRWYLLGFLPFPFGFGNVLGGAIMSWGWCNGVCITGLWKYKLIMTFNFAVIYNMKGTWFWNIGSDMSFH